MTEFENVREALDVLISFRRRRDATDIEGSPREIKNLPLLHQRQISRLFVTRNGAGCSK